MTSRDGKYLTRSEMRSLKRERQFPGELAFLSSMDVDGSRALENSDSGVFQSSRQLMIAGSCSGTHLSQNRLPVGLCCQNCMPGQGGRTCPCCPLGTVGQGHAMELHMKNISQLSYMQQQPWFQQAVTHGEERWSEIKYPMSSTATD